MNPSELQVLLQQIRSGDRAARRRLMELLGDEDRLGSVLLRIVRKRLPSDHRARRLLDSRDVAQSALRTALHELSRFRGETERTLYGWLGKIIRSKISRAARRIDPPDRSTPSQASPSPLEEIVEQDLIAALQAAIQQLPLDQRLVVELRLRGLNSAEAAEILGLKPATVRKREQRALGNLRRLMGEPG